MMNRRQFLRLSGLTAGVVAAAGLLSACGGADSGDDDDRSEEGVTEPTGVEVTPDRSTGSPEATVGGSQLAPRGEIIIAAPQDRHSPDSSLPNIGMSIPNPSIYETLIGITPDFELEPRLAESWELIEPNTWRFSLRQSVIFHDGTPFTAEAVEWTMARTAASGGGVLRIGEDSVVIVDDFTVEITPTQHNSLLPLQMSGPRTGCILAPGSNNAEVRIGTGPFREVEYVKDERHVVEAFPDYWGEQARLERITFLYMPDPTTRMLALQAGDVDLIFDVPRESAIELESADGRRLVRSAIGAYNSLSFNIHGEEPYDLGQDPVIREAVALAIDRDAIITGGWQGYAEPNNTMIPEGVLGDAASLIQGPSYDPERAEQLLDDAGWTRSGDTREKDGRTLHLAMIVGYPSAEIHRPMPELVQAQLAEIGIELEIVQTPDAGSYAARLTSREGDLWAEVGNQVDADPSYLPSLLYYSPIDGADAEANAYANAFAPGAAFDALIDECRAAPTIEEAQVAAANAMKLMIDDEHIVIPIAGVIRLYGVADRVQTFEPHSVQFVERWEHVSVTDD